MVELYRLKNKLTYFDKLKHTGSYHETAKFNDESESLMAILIRKVFGRITSRH
jgi:hypothetical protein